MRLREMMPIIGHIQIASIPLRHEPDEEELNYPFLFTELDRLRYWRLLSAANTIRAARPPRASAGSSPMQEQNLDARCPPRLHRRRLHRRLRSRQHPDPLRPAHGADHRRAGRPILNCPTSMRWWCCSKAGRSNFSIGGDALARRRTLAARPGCGSHPVQDLLDLRFHRCRQDPPGDGCVTQSIPAMPSFW